MVVALTTVVEESLAETTPAEATDGTTMMVSLLAITTIGTLAVATATTIMAIGIASFAMACGFGWAEPTITLAAIATGCCKGLNTLTAHIGGAAITPASAITKPLKRNEFPGRSPNPLFGPLAHGSRGAFLSDETQSRLAN